jgi:hypothetical protein
VIPVAILAEFEFRSEFHRNGNYNLAGTPAKIPFPRNSRNYPDSRGFRQEYMGDCKELDNRGDFATINFGISQLKSLPLAVVSFFRVMAIVTWMVGVDLGQKGLGLMKGSCIGGDGPLGLQLGVFTT